MADTLPVVNPGVDRVRMPRRRGRRAPVGRRTASMTQATDPVIVAATRTPIGRSGRSLAGLGLHDIGLQTLQGVIDAAGLDPMDIDDLIIGEVLQGGGDTARYLANALGLP